MLDLSFLVSLLNSTPPIVSSLLTLLAGYFFLSLFAFLFGKNGIYCYMIMATLMANIQVLKVSQFAFFGSPVALGTELFATTFLATDILTEVFGERSARKAVFLGFFVLLAWSVFSLLTLGFRPVSLDQVQGDGFLFEMQTHLSAIFLPIPRFFVASIVAYLISQTVDIAIFARLKRINQKKKLWLRNNLSTILSSLLDSAVFSFLAFVLLNPNPVSFSSLIFTYILGTYIFRVIAALFDTPVIYMLRPVLQRRFSAKALGEGTG